MFKITRKHQLSIVVILVVYISYYLIFYKIVKYNPVLKHSDVHLRHEQVVKSLAKMAEGNNLALYKNKKIVIGGCVKNVQKHLPAVFDNIVTICDLFSYCRVIVYYDKSWKDDTLKYLNDYSKALKGKLTIIKNPNFISKKYRTHRIAFGRNKIIEKIENDFSNYDYFINIDFDDVSSTKINISNLTKTLALANQYDVVTFARDSYYDIWALRYNNFLINSHDISKDSSKNTAYCSIIREDITKQLSKLRDDEFFEVDSAFNGFGVYKIPKLYGCRYSGENILFKVPNGRNKKEDCEHVSFHRCLRLENGARIVISPRKLF